MISAIHPDQNSTISSNAISSGCLAQKFNKVSKGLSLRISTNKSKLLNTNINARQSYQNSYCKSSISNVVPHDLPSPPIPPISIETIDSSPDEQQPLSLIQTFIQGPLEPKFEEKYELKDELGSGASGFVVTATRVADGIDVAVKFIFKERIPLTSMMIESDGCLVPMEIFILSKVNHPHIVKYIEHFEDDKVGIHIYNVIIRFSFLFLYPLDLYSIFTNTKTPNKLFVIILLIVFLYGHGILWNFVDAKYTS